MSDTDSVPPSGDPDRLMDPYPDEEEDDYEDPIDGALALAKKYVNVDSLKTNWPYIVAFFVATVIVVGSIIALHHYDHVHWVGGIFIWVDILVVLSISLARKWGSVWTFMSKGRRQFSSVVLLVAILLALPRYSPMLVTRYWEGLGADIEQPKICTLWMVDTSGFTDKESLARWNPDQEKNREIRGAILISARMADLDTPELVTYEDCPEEKGRPLAFVIFQKVQTSMEIVVVPKDEKKGDEPELKIEGSEGPQVKTEIVWRSELKVLFAVRSPTSDEDKESPFKMVRLIVPPPFDLDVKLLVDAFAQASGKKVSLEDLQQIMGESPGSPPSASSNGGKG